MRTHRFGRKIKLPASIAIKHQIRMLMALDEVKKAEAQLIDRPAPRAVRQGTLPLSALGHGDKSVQIPLTPIGAVTKHGD